MYGLADLLMSLMTAGFFLVKNFNGEVLKNPGEGWWCGGGVCEIVSFC